MTLSGNICEADWSVSAQVESTTGGYRCRIGVNHLTPQGVFKHEFKHSKLFPTEREAVLEGLREGMVWLGLKRSNTLNL